MRLMYVFDFRATTGYVFRAPEFLARFICRRKWAHARYLDYAPTEKGL